MISRCRLAVGVLCLSVCAQTIAHDVGGIERELGESERYVQVVDTPAKDFRLQDPEGGHFSLRDFRGKVVVLYFLYSRCKDECPLHSLKIAEIQKQISEAQLSDHVQFVAIATDVEPAESTAEHMRSHAGKYGLDTGNWMFVYGGPERRTAGMTLAQDYALQFTPAGEEVQLHGVVTHLIDPEGRLRARYHGLDFDPLKLTVYAAALIHGEHGETATDHADGGAAFEMPYWAAVTGGVLSVIFLFAAGWFYFREVRGQRRES